MRQESPIPLVKNRSKYFKRRISGLSRKGNKKCRGRYPRDRFLFSKNLLTGRCCKIYLIAKAPGQDFISGA